MLLLTHVGWAKTPDCTIISASKCTFLSFGFTSLAKQSLFCAVIPNSCLQWSAADFTRLVVATVTFSVTNTVTGTYKCNIHPFDSCVQNVKCLIHKSNPTSLALSNKSLEYERNFCTIGFV